jgi:hypothetical protein
MGAAVTRSAGAAGRRSAQAWGELEVKPLPRRAGAEALGAARTRNAGAARRRSWVRAEVAESYCPEAQPCGGTGRGTEPLGAGGAGLLVARCRAVTAVEEWSADAADRKLAGLAQGASSIDRRSGD